MTTLPTRVVSKPYQRCASQNSHCSSGCVPRVKSTVTKTLIPPSFVSKPSPELQNLEKRNSSVNNVAFVVPLQPILAARTLGRPARRVNETDLNAPQNVSELLPPVAGMTSSLTGVYCWDCRDDLAQSKLTTSLENSPLAPETPISLPCLPTACHWLLTTYARFANPGLF